MTVSAAVADRSSKRPLCAPSCIESIVDNIVGNPYPIRPLRHWEADPFVFNKFVIAPVAPLLLPCGPPTILRAVIPIVIYPVKRRSIGLVRHVGYKVRKAISPPVTNPNPPSPIEAICCIVRVVTSTNHALPCAVQRMMRQTMSSMRTDCNISAVTPATTCATGLQTLKSSSHQFPAITFALAHNVSSGDNY